MNENAVCPIWGTVASVGGVMNRPGVKVVDSPRAGGQYVIFRRARTMLNDRDERFKTRLTSWLIEQRRLGVEHPEITEHTIPEIEKRRDLPVHERADGLLQYIGIATSAIGELIPFERPGEEILFAASVNLENISDGSLNHYRMMAWSGCTKSDRFDEIEYLLGYLQNEGWIEYEHGSGVCTLTVEGYARLAELEKVAIDSSQAFVAMWFDDSMNDVYENSVRPGIEDAGYEARRIDRVEHINKIDDEIIAEIRRSRFVVADFTHGDSGARGGVYYEAGFAHGLDIPVIFTCRNDVLENIHFDTRQYNHIPWEPEKLEEFRKALSDRISAVIGDGPNKTQDAG